MLWQARVAAHPHTLVSTALVLGTHLPSVWGTRNITEQEKRVKPSKRQQRFDRWIDTQWMKGLERKHPEVAQKLKALSAQMKAQEQQKEKKEG